MQFYGVSAAKEGEQGQIFMQTKEGFEKNLPPVRLSMEQRKSMMDDFENFNDIAESEPQEVVGPP